MSTTVAGPDLRVDVARWSGCSMPRDEITAALTFLAHKATRSIRCTPYHGAVQYSADSVYVYIHTAATCSGAVSCSHVKLNGTTHELSSSQRAFPSRDLPGADIKDDEGRILAKVDHNCIVIFLDLTAVDNEAGRAVLAYVVEQAIPLLDFDVEDKAKEQQAKITEQYDAFHQAAVKSRIDERSREVNRLEREATEHYYRLVNVERELPLARQELDLLTELSTSRVEPVVEKQTGGIVALLNNQQFEEITPAPDGSLYARTSNILIEHDDWVFELGRYEINIDPTGKVTVHSTDGIDGEGYPHPHVDSNGRPCLGNISADLAKAIGQMRVFEALTLIYDFVASYNEEGAFIRIGKFDSDYDDPDENPCDDCDDYHTPYCICECSHNDGNWSCGDCSEYRTEYCYTECGYNVPGFAFVNPCDDCEERGAYCFLECPYNSEWQVNSPCNECSLESCDDCNYADKKVELDAKTHPTATS